MLRCQRLIVLCQTGVSRDDRPRLLGDDSVLALCTLSEDEVVGVVDLNAPEAAVALGRIRMSGDSLLPAHARPAGALAWPARRHSPADHPPVHRGLDGMVGLAQRIGR